MSSHVGNLNSGGLYRWLYDYQTIFSHYCQPSVLPTILFVCTTYLWLIKPHVIAHDVKLRGSGTSITFDSVSIEG